MIILYGVCLLLVAVTCYEAGFMVGRITAKEDSEEE